MSFFETRLTKLFGIEYPIIQGGMAAGLVSTAELAAAVGNAGGIGFMSAHRSEGQGLGGRTAMNTGDIEEGVLPLGMVSGRIKEVKPVKEIVDDIVAEADEVIEKLANRKYLKA